MKQLFLLFLTLLSVLFSVLFSSFTIETAETVGDPPCDVIILQTGDRLEVEIVKTSTETVEYRDCGSKNGEIKTIAQSKIQSISYGATNTATNRSGNAQADKPFKKRSPTESLLAFIFLISAIALALLLLLVVVIFLGAALATGGPALILGIILFIFLAYIFGFLAAGLIIAAIPLIFVGMEKIRKNPVKYKKDLSIAAFILLTLTVILTIIFAIATPPAYIVAALLFGGAIWYLLPFFKKTPKK